MLRCLGPSCVMALSHLLNILNKYISLGTPATAVIHSQVYGSLTLSHERYSRCTKSACDVICGIFVALFGGLFAFPGMKIKVKFMLKGKVRNLKNIVN